MTGRSLLLATVAGCLASALLAASVGPATADTTGAAVPAGPSGPSPANAAKTATPIKHLVVIFNENVSFDHYFATYPSASNPPGEPRFVGVHGTPRVDSLASANLLTKNPNTNPENGADAALPFRLDRTQANTADQNHAYTAEQQAYNGGKADLFPKYTGKGTPGGAGSFATKGQVMGYFDGNTVTALWRYAQHFALNDNSYVTQFGPSSPGAINLISGQTNGVASTLNGTGDEVAGGPDGSLTVIGDADPIGDVCSNPTRNQVQMSGKNIGDLLTAAGVTWGGFMGGFNLSTVNSNGTTGCARSSTGLSGTTGDYIAHHSLFGYYASTGNPNHTRPASLAEIGNAGPANHQYDTQDFFAAVAAGNFPAVSFLKAPAFQDGHAGYSNPLDEQTWIVNTINFLEALPSWSSTAVVIMYDDSDGWYDHQMGPIFNTSTGPADALTGPGACGTAATSLPGVNPMANPHALGRCGYGPRLPLVVVSPWARQNFVDSTVTDQTSIIHFIEDNWLAGQRIGNGSFDSVANSITQMFNFTKMRNNGVLFLNPSTGKKF